MSWRYLVRCGSNSALASLSEIRYPDEETMVRGLLSPGVIVELVSHVGEKAVRSAFLGALARFRAADGSYRFDNEWHTLIATA